MWLDYVGMVPGIAAALMGVTTLTYTHMPRWKKVLVAVLTVVAVGATGISQWWTLHEKNIEQARLAEILEQLGRFIGEGENLAALVQRAEPLPEAQLNDWANRTEKFLKTIGDAYVIRFRSNVGLATNLSPQGLDQAHVLYWHVIRTRLIRLNEFAAEFSGQVAARS